MCALALFVSLFTGLFEVRAAEYLASCPEPELSGVNKFLKGLGKPLASTLPKKGIICFICFFTVTICCAFREQNEVLTEKVRDCLSRREDESHVWRAKRGGAL